MEAGDSPAATSPMATSPVAEPVEAPATLQQGPPAESAPVLPTPEDNNAPSGGAEPAANASVEAPSAASAQEAGQDSSSTVAAASEASASAAGPIGASPNVPQVDPEEASTATISPPISPSVARTASQVLEARESKMPAFPTSADGYQIREKIGQGAFAKVFRAFCPTMDQEVAIKVLDLEQYDSNWTEIRKEIQIMSLCDHPNVVKYHCSFVNDHELWIVMPYLGGGSCSNILKTAFPGGLRDENVIATILRETLKGLEYFHKNGQIHRDIKAGNILLDMNGNVQLADFGVAAHLMESGDRKKTRQTFVGTPCWMAPEVMAQQSGYNQKADIWSFGITAMELAHGHAPFAKYPPLKVLLLTLQNDPPRLEDAKSNRRFSDSFRKLVEKCLRKNPAERPTASKLLEMRFLKNAKKPEYLVQNLISTMPPLHERPSPQNEEEKQAEQAEQQQARTAEALTDQQSAAPGTSWIFTDEEKNQLREIRERNYNEDGGAGASLGGNENAGNPQSAPSEPSAVRASSTSQAKESDPMLEDLENYLLHGK